MQFVRALKVGSEGVTIRVEVKPGSRNLGVEGYNAWRQAIIIRVTERAQSGKANSQLIRYLAQILERRVNDVILVSGHTGTSKLVLLPNAVAEEVESIIIKAIASGVN